MRRLLEKNNLRVQLTEPQLGCTDIGSLFYHIFEERKKLDRKYLYSSPKPAAPFAHLDLTVFADAICEKVENLIALNQQLVVEDFARIPDLAIRLSEGMPIGSYPKSDITNSKKESSADNRLSLNDQGMLDPQKYTEAIKALRSIKRNAVTMQETGGSTLLPDIRSLKNRFDGFVESIVDEVDIAIEGLEGK